MYLSEPSTQPGDSLRYAKCIEVSKLIRWDIDHDVIRGRSFDFSQKFLPDGLSYISKLVFLRPDEQLLLNQIQGRTYANMFGVIERFIGAKVLDLTRSHWFSDQTALQALVRVTDEELKHQTCTKTFFCSTGARSHSTRFWGSWSGCEKMPASRPFSAMNPWTI